jgi:FKBP-type peptidyl-prolyl cis-trans isomerase (trigger factor)
MALPFAKVVLYTQLCSERTANGGQPGELEQALGAGGNIRENIEKTAQTLANDQIFKNLVLKKIGEENNGKILPNRSKFERMIISGGYNGFWLEYKQNLKEFGNQNEQQVRANEEQLENQNQKQQDAPKTLM